MTSDLFLEHNGNARVWLRWFAALLFVIVGLTGCATTNGSIVKMSTQDVVGPVASVEKITETTTDKDGKSVTKVTERTVTMSAPAANFELKKLGITTVGNVGVARANNAGIMWGNSQMNGMGGMGMGGQVYGGPNSMCRNIDGNFVTCQSMNPGGGIPRGVYPTSSGPSGTNIVFKN
jgi:hypothetical protein